MKINKAFLSIFTIMGMACYGVASADNEGKVNFKWESDIHDFGAFNEDVGRVTCQFKGVNLGPDTASVIYLNASCGCTTPKASSIKKSPSAPCLATAPISTSREV